MRAFESALILLLLVLGVSPRPVRAGENQLRPAITVLGTGEISARPDQAQVTLGVVTQATTASAALDANTRSIKSLFETIAKHGIAEKDMQTSNFSVSPQYRHDRAGTNPPEIVGYQVSNQVRVKVRQLESVGKLLDSVVQGGANQIQGVQFSVADPQPLLDAARRKAVADARRKAELYAKEAGVVLGPVLSIDEQVHGGPRPFEGGMVREMAAAVPIAAGEQDFQVSIVMKFAIEPGNPGK